MKRCKLGIFFMALLLPFISFSAPCEINFITSDEAIFKLGQTTTFIVKAEPIGLIFLKNTKIPRGLTFQDNQDGTATITVDSVGTKKKKFTLILEAISSNDPNASFGDLFECYQCQTQGVSCPTKCSNTCTAEQKLKIRVK